MCSVSKPQIRALKCARVYLWAIFMGPQLYGFLLLITLMSILMACVRTEAKNSFPLPTAQKMNRCVHYVSRVYVFAWQAHRIGNRFKSVARDYHRLSINKTHWGQLNYNWQALAIYVSTANRYILKSDAQRCNQIFIGARTDYWTCQCYKLNLN